MIHNAQPLIRKFENFNRLSRDDRDALDAAVAKRARNIGAREDIFREGDTPDAINVFLSGWGCRYKMLEDGRRQIVSFFLPGDTCDYNITLLKQMDHSVGTLTPMVVASLSVNVIEEITLNHPRVYRAFWWETLVHGAILREWAVNLGQRDAFERIGHLLCELFIRLRSIGATQGDSCEFPLTQADLADATGLSVVHVNRSLQELRAAKLIVLRGRSLTIPDFPALQQASLFNPNYLHLDHEGSQHDAHDP